MHSDFFKKRVGFVGAMMLLARELMKTFDIDLQDGDFGRGKGNSVVYLWAGWRHSSL